MRRMHSPVGFTLIEIIVVLIILGVLAAIAIPSFFSHIYRSKRVATALVTIKEIKDKVVACASAHSSDMTICGTLGASDISGMEYRVTLGTPPSQPPYIDVTVFDTTGDGSSLNLRIQNSASPGSLVIDSNMTISCSIPNGTLFQGMCF